jgi:arylsulfatase A-like enzyme
MRHATKDLSVAICLAVVALLLPMPRSAVAAPARPNVVLCMADDQGLGDMGYTGHPRVQTPTFDAMSREGLRFDRFYAAAPVCSPTRGSVMTGRHPNRFGCFRWGNTLRPQEVTVAEALGSAGYRTGHFGKWHLGSVVARSPVSPGNSGFARWLSAPNFYDNDPILSRDGTAVALKGESSMIVAEAAMEFVREAVAAKEPFLAVVWFGSPHRPHEAVEADREPYRDLPEKLQHFYGEITGMDRAVGHLREGLVDLGVREDTLFWYSSDNGALPDVGSTAGLRGVKGDVYEGGLRVPALIEWPARIPEPRATDAIATTSDIYPTLLDLLGIEIPGQPVLDGVSLRWVIEGAAPAPRAPVGFWSFDAQGIRTPSREWMALLLEAQEQGQEAEIPPDQLMMDAGALEVRYDETDLTGHAAWLDGDWKLHRVTGDDGSPHFELYELDEDPVEDVDLASRHPGRVATMTAALEVWMLSVIDSLNGADY